MTDEEKFYLSVGKTKSSTFQNARNLALGIGIQNFPEVA